MILKLISYFNLSILSVAVSMRVFSPWFGSFVPQFLRNNGDFSETMSLLSLSSLFLMIGTFRFASKDSTYYKFPPKIFMCFAAAFIVITRILSNSRNIKEKVNDGKVLLHDFWFDVSISVYTLITAVVAWYSCPNNDEEFESENCWNSFFYSAGIFLFSSLVIGDFAMYTLSRNLSRLPFHPWFLFSAAATLLALSMTIIHPFVVPVTWSSKVISGSSRISLAINSMFTIWYIFDIMFRETQFRETPNASIQEFLTPMFLIPCIHSVLSPIASIVSSLSAVSADEMPKARSSFV